MFSISKSIFVGVLLFAFQTHAAEFTIKSSNLDPNKPLANKHVFNSFGCNGENISPQLEWKNAPKGTKSFAVTVYDPDAPTGSGWWHWTVFNIPAKVNKLSENASAQTDQLPKGSVQGRTDYGKPGFGGACPPPGDAPHRYVFTVHALKIDKIDLDQEASPAMLGFYIHQNSLGKASMTVKFGR